jgi:hypothetical protein
LSFSHLVIFKESARPPPHNTSKLSATSGILHFRGLDAQLAEMTPEITCALHKTRVSRFRVPRPV